MKRFLAFVALAACCAWADPQPTLSITKGHTGNFTQGQNATWSIVVSIGGTGSTSSVTVTDTLPSGYTLVSSSPVSWNCTGTSSVSCTNSTNIGAGSSYPTLSLTVAVPANSPLSVQNTAQVSSAGAVNSPQTSAADTVTVNQVPASITATSGGMQSANVNAAFTNPLVATVKDAGGVVIPGATVTFTPPSSGASGTFTGGANTATTNASGQATSAVFTANGTTGTYSVTAASGAATGASFSLTNTAAPAPVLSVTKAHTPASFTQGSTGTWNIVVANSGTGPTSGALTVTDTLPTGYTLASFSGTGWNCAGTGTANVSCTNSTTVAPGNSFVTLALTVNVPAASATSVMNTATASGGGAASSATSNADTVSVTQVAATIVAAGGTPQSATVNTAFTNPLVATVKDAGGVAIQGATVTFTAPVSGASGTFAGGVNTATTNASGQAMSGVFTANATAGAYMVTATSGAATGASFSLTNTAAPSASLSITKTHSGTFTQGQMGSWTIKVTNTGTGATSGPVTVSDTLPAGYALVSFGGPNWSCTGTSSVSCTDSVDTAVAANSTFPTLTITVSVPANSPVSVQNSASVSGGSAANSPQTSSLDTVAVTQVPATITATSGGGQSATVNAAFANPLVATVKDAGGIAIQGATVTFNVVPNAGAGGSFAGGVNTAATDINGQATSAVFTANGTAGTYSVTAASGAATGASFSLTNTAAAAPVLSVTKGHSPTTFTQGQTATWTINVSNTGAGATSGAVTVADMLPTGYTLSSSSGAGWNCTGTGTANVSCSNSTVVASNGAFSQLSLTVNVPANSAVSVQNTATASGGGAASSATSNTDTVSVTQVAATIVATSGTPQSTMVNTAFANPLVATVKDAGGVAIQGATVTFTVVPNAGAGGSFAGGVSTATTNPSGQATSALFTANGTAGTYTVTAASGAATGATFSLTNTGGTPTKLEFSTQPPASANAGATFTAVVQIEDSGGSVVTSSNAAVTISSTPAGVAGMLTVNAVNGVATFNNLSVNAANSYTLKASSSGLTDAISNSIQINAAAASQVVFTTPPNGGTAGQALTPAVVVKIEDAFNNVVTSSNAAVTASSTPPGVTGTLQVNAVSGVATFNNLVFNAANSYTLTAASAGLTSALSGSFTISAGSSTKLVFTTQPPANGTAGTAFSATVQVQDAGGNLVTGSNAQITISSSPAGVGGTTTLPAVNGVAMFTNLTISQTGSYMLTAAAQGLTNATSTSIAIGAASPTQVVFTTPPGSGTAGQALTPPVAVSIEDQFGNVVTSGTPQVTISSTPSGVTGTLQVNASNGVAAFSNLQFNAANNYTLTASSGSLTPATSASFTISAGSGSKLVFTTQPPSSAMAGAAFNAVVQVQDNGGNLVTGANVQVAISSSPAGLTGVTTVTASGGVATFSNLMLKTTGSYTLTATSTGLTNATSTSIVISPAAASQIVFTTPPNSGTAGQALTPAVVATIEDAFNNVVTTSNAPVTASSTPSGAGGTLQVNAASGVATFNNLVFNAANNYTLTVASPGLASATSAAFTISVGSGNKLVVTVQPPASATAGQTLSPSIAVQVQDSVGNLVTGSTASISISSTPAGVGGTLTANASGGIATFSDLSFTTSGNYTLTATSTGLSNATSTSIAVAPADAKKLVFSVKPSSGTAGQALSPAVVVQVQDTFGNLVTGSSASVTLSSTPSGVGGTLTATASGGIATFSGLTFTASGNYTLTAAAPSLTSATSASFTISAGSGNKLVITTQPPSSGTAGQPLSPSLVVQVQDANGNLVTNSGASVSIGSTPTGVGGTLTATATGGVATFGNLSFNAIGNYTLTATSTGLTNATSTSIAIAPASAAKLAFTLQPSSGTAGQPLAPAVAVQVQDSFGNLIATSTASVSISSVPSGVGGTTTANAVGGIATFNNLSFTSAGNYTLNAASSGLTGANSTGFTISAGSGNKLAFATQPTATGTAGQPLPPVIVQIQDANGNLATASTAAVSISANPAIIGGTLSTAATGGVSGTLTVNAVGGVATFNNLVFNTTGSYTLTATSTGLANATSASVAIFPGPANKLSFVQQPSSGTAAHPLSPAVQVQVQDANGNLVNTSNAPVSISSVPLGVGGTLNMNASGGIATFNNLAFTAANNYTLSASSNGLTPAISNPFTIAAGAPGGIAIVSGSGQTALVNRNFSNPLVVSVTDSAGNAVPNVNVTFTAPGSGPGGTFGGSAIATALTGSTGQAASPTFTANGVSGTYVVVASAAGVTNTVSFALTNVANLSVTTSSLANGTQSSPYQQQLVATGGTPPYSWSLSAGNLPNGLTLFSSGLISGTPAASGNFSFTARVKDSLGATADQVLSLAVASTLAISACPASSGIVNVPYTSTATANGGQTPYTWSFTSGAFPPGLALNALTGAVTGTPTSSGAFTVTLVVTDKTSATAQLGCGFTIAPALSITTQTVSDGSQSAPYSQQLLAAGGKPPYTWSVAGGAPPPGLALTPTGTLSGTPTVTANNVSFVVAVTDSTPTTVQRTYNMNVFAGLIVGKCPQDTGEVGFPYNSTLTGEGGAPPYAWSVGSGLPQGLTLNTVAGAIAGTPTQVGPASLTFTITDKSNRTNTRQCPLNVQPAVSISTATLSGGSTGASYADGVNVSGGVQPYVYSTTGGSLPPGLAIAGDTGKISGRPIASGQFSFTVQVTDNLGAQATKNLSIAVSQGLIIPNCPAPVGNVGQPYSSPLVAQGGSTPYVWSINSGTLPAGLSLQVSDAVSAIAGTPSAPGASAFVVQAVDGAGSNVTRACSIQINAAPLTITAPTFPTALLGTAYSQTLAAAGGRGPYIWAIVGSGAPPGFSIDSTGVLSGVPSSVGTFTFTVQVTDQDGNVAQQSVTITILAGTAPTVTITGLSDIVDAATQPTFNIQLSGGYPAPITGTLTLTFVPDPTIGIDDPSVQFAPKGRTLPFTVGANATNASIAAPGAILQTGTVAGTIQLSVQLLSGGVEITPAGTVVRSVRIDRLAPKIVSMTATQTSSGITVTIVGYSTTREVTQGTFQFAVSGGTPLSATVQLSDGAKSWFSSTQSNQYGGQFTLTQPFTLQGTVGTLTSVTVTLSNGQGTSAPATANF